MTLTISRGKIISEDAFRASFSFVIAIEPLISEPREKSHEVAEGVCFREDHREHEMKREKETEGRVLVFS
ncbi:hypothetical protein DS66_09425 [Mesotoga sp. SC_3PWM13N19]|nr:hypothetical protein DS66_09425 [Mesotoga sp. SC_3PWM13N19]